MRGEVEWWWRGGASMSAVHCCAVWEWQSSAGWLPHAPGVARTLERAHAKRLTRVVLADADPALRGHAVNLRTLTQYSDTPEGGTVECAVRRSCYPVQSAAGRGVRWDWAPLAAHHSRAQDYEPMPMEVQCLVEEAWQRGGDSVAWEGWALSVSRLRARRGGAVRALRRAPQPPYPLARVPPPQPPTPPARPLAEGRRIRIPQQHTGSSVHSVQSLQSMQSVQSVQSVQSAPARPGARSASPKERKPGLARQILHNLNIFSSSSNKPPPPERAEKVSRAAGGDCRGDTRGDCRGDTRGEGGGDSAGDGGSTRSARRHSVDTVSTYLSHESKESLQQASAGSLLNCSAGSDEVFESCPPVSPGSPAPLISLGAPDPVAPPLDLVHFDADIENDLITGGEAEDAAEAALVAAGVSGWVRCVCVPQWGAVCWACLGALGGGPGEAGQAGGQPRVVALARCHHLLHLHCLHRHLRTLQHQRRPLHIHCRVCGDVYGCTEEPPPPSVGAPQPAGSMAWRLQPAPLPQHDVPTILVTYNFQSGRQGPQHPQPGAPYYAVGFPRYSLLPDNALGRQVLMALREAWSAAQLFCVCASQTTGREHVVAWRCAPPPHRAAQYAQPACPERLLRAALARLQRRSVAVYTSGGTTTSGGMFPLQTSI